MTTDEYDYDLLVIGSGPGGQRASVAAAKLGKRVAVVDRRGMVGGVCINTGTIPSKTLREAVLYLTGMAQRDSRTRELLEMLSHRTINRLLVVSASAQGETIEDQLGAYAAASCRGMVLSKLDEAVKLGPALDAMIRHRLKVLAVANGQRVPEDWHRLSAHALVQRALKGVSAPAWRLDDSDVGLIFAGLPAMAGSAASPTLHA